MASPLNLKQEIDAFKRVLPSAPDFRVQRSQLIHSISRVYDGTHSEPSGLNQGLFPSGLCDDYLKKAKEVSKRFFDSSARKIVPIHPIAARYLLSWEGILSSNDRDLPLKIDAFVSAHREFVCQYSKDFCQSRSDQIHVDFRESIRLCYASLAIFISENSNISIPFAPESMQRVYFMVAILGFMKNRNWITSEIFPIEDLTALYSYWDRLSPAEMETIEALIKQDRLELNGNIGAFYMRAQKLYWKIVESHSPDDLSQFVIALGREMEEDLKLANCFQGELEGIEIDWGERGAGILFTLLQLSPNSLKRLYSFMPLLAKIESCQVDFAAKREQIRDYLYSNKGIDSDKGLQQDLNYLRGILLNHPKAYRLCSILMLAKSL